MQSVHLEDEEALLQARLAQCRGRYMPPSRLATLEEPSEAMVVDVSGTPEQIRQALRGMED